MNCWLVDTRSLDFRTSLLRRIKNAVSSFYSSTKQITIAVKVLRLIKEKAARINFIFDYRCIIHSQFIEKSQSRASLLFCDNNQSSPYPTSIKWCELQSKKVSFHRNIKEWPWESTKTLDTFLVFRRKLVTERFDLL